MPIGPLFIMIAAILWGIDGIIRRSLFTLPPIIIVFYEHLFGLILLSPFFIPQLLKTKISTKTWAALLWVAFLSGVLGTLWFTTALIKVNFISFSVVFLLQKLQPIFTIATAAIVLKEKVTKDYFKWAALAVIAAYFVTFPNGAVNLATGAGTVIAALYAVGAAFAWGSTTVFSKVALKDLSTTLTTGLRFLLTVPIAFLFIIFMGQTQAISAPEPSQYLRFLIIALSTGMVALWIYYQGLRKTEAKVSTIVELAFPLTAVLIDLFYYKHALELSQYLAAAVLFFAISRVSKLNKG